MQTKKNEGTSSIQTSLAILDLFTWENPTRSLSEIVEAMDMPLPTASRIVNTLCDKGFLEKNRRLYQLGWKCCRMGALYRASDQTKALIEPAMRELRDRFNETVNAYKRNGNWRICIEQVPSTHVLKRFANLGDSLPLWAGASGRCFMAWMTPEELAGLRAEVPEEVLSRWDILMERCARVRREGFTISVAEREQGISSISSPVFDFSRLPVVVLAISGPSFRFTDNLVAQIIPTLVSKAQELSLALGAPEKMLNFTLPQQFPAGQ